MNLVYPPAPKWLKPEDLHLWKNLVNALDEIEEYRAMTLDEFFDRACYDEPIESAADDNLHVLFRSSEPASDDDPYVLIRSSELSNIEPDPELDGPYTPVHITIHPSTSSTDESEN